jgi:uncharacterized protein (DUF58 family)
MKRKLKIAGFALVLVSLCSAVVSSATSGSVGFGIAVILSFFLAVFALVGLFFLSVKQFRVLKDIFTHLEKTVVPVEAKVCDQSDSEKKEG